MTIHWVENLYGTNVEKIDEQHREIFRQTNKLEEIIHGGGKAEEIRPILEFLDKYVKSHFACEELIMDQRRCGSCKENKAAHAVFITEYAKIKSRMLADVTSEPALRELFSFLANWLRMHIMKIDVKLKNTTA